MCWVSTVHVANTVRCGVSAEHGHKVDAILRVTIISWIPFPDLAKV